MYMYMTLYSAIETITVEQQEKLSYLRKENNNLKESVTQLSNELSLHPLWGMVR